MIELQLQFWPTKFVEQTKFAILAMVRRRIDDLVLNWQKGRHLVIHVILNSNMSIEQTLFQQRFLIARRIQIENASHDE